MKERKKERNRGLLKGFVGATIVTIFIVSAILPSGASENGETAVSIDPPSRLVSGNDTFTVNVTINPAEPIAGAQADLLFDPSLITVNNVTDGGMFECWFASQIEIDNVNGIVGNMTGFSMENVTTPGVFAIIEFTTGNTSGTSPLNLINVIVGDPDMNPVDVTINNGSITIDAVEPVVELIYPKGGEIISGITTIKWNATDDIGILNGTIWIQYSDDNGTTWNEIARNLNNTGEYDWNTTNVSDGSYLMMVNATDYAGNIASNKSSTFMIDNTPPKTTCHPSGKIGKNGWYVSNVTVTLTATDGTSGVNYTMYNLDGTGWVKYTAPFMVITDKIHTIKYYSVDMAGNVESTNSATIKIDKTNPFINIERPKEGYLYIFDREIIPTPFHKTRIIGSITIKVNATDTLSGIDGVEFYVDGTLKNTDPGAPYEWTWDERAFFKHSIKVMAYDKAGNEATDEIEVVIFNIKN